MYKSEVLEIALTGRAIESLARGSPGAALHWPMHAPRIEDVGPGIRFGSLRFTERARLDVLCAPAAGEASLLSASVHVAGFSAEGPV